MADNSANKVSVLVVDSLPLVGIPGIIYLVPITDIGETNKFKEYIWLKSGQIWESLGAVTANLDNYAVLNGDNTFTANQTIVGTLSTTGTITAGSIVTPAISGDVTVSGSYTTTGSVAASTITTERLIGTLTVTNGDINTTGTLNADTVTANIINGNISVEGDITASGTISGATINAQSIDGITNISGDVNVDTVTATVLTAENINGDITNVSGDVTLGETTITGDVTINGGMDTGAKGKAIIPVYSQDVQIIDNIWYSNTDQSVINVSPATWDDTAKTCRLISSIPVTLNGVIWLGGSPEFDPTKSIFEIELNQTSASLITAVLKGTSEPELVGYYQPSVTNGILSWTASNPDLPFAASADVTGPRGPQGPPGVTSSTGEPIINITSSSFIISHACWHVNTGLSSITVIPGNWINEVMTCYLKTSIPVTLSGVTWLYGEPAMVDTFIYVIALQQIDESTVLANLAYTLSK